MLNLKKATPTKTIRLAAASLTLALLSACAAPLPSVPPTPMPAPAASATPAPAGEAAPEPTQPPAQPSPTSAATLAAPLAASPTPQPSPTSAAARPTATKPAPVRPSAFPDPANYTWQTAASGLTRPLAVTGDRQGRLLVIEQPGRIRLVDADGLRPAPFLDISAQVGSNGNEQGLLGLALHPAYAQNGVFFVNYTDLKGDTVIARFSANRDRASADPASQKILLRIKQPYPNHNGGSLAFGPDGFLYMGLGDGGSAGDPQANGQNLNVLLGKILRIDVDSGDPYAIPATNPFQGGGKKAEIWAYGLRNPWRFSFDRATGDFFIGDVGQNTWEEIDYLPAGSPGGANLGWNLREGTHAFKGQSPAGLSLLEPIYEYKHPTGCSVTGGYVYRGAALPELQGVYLFGDYCNGKIWGLIGAPDGKWNAQLLFQSGAFLSSFGEDDLGELYITDNDAGVVLKLVKK